MKRLLQSIAGGFLIPASLLVIAAIIGGTFELDKFGAAFIYLAAFPLVPIAPFLPASDSPDPNAPLIRVALYLSALLCDVIIYSLVTYTFLWWRAKRRRLA